MTDEAKQPRRKRRWLRFSLRTFLIVLTILCVWLGWYLYRVEKQREAVKWVLKKGGEVRYDYEIDDDDYLFYPPYEPVDIKPPIKKWLVDMLGVDYFASVELVGFYETQSGDLTPLAGLKHLEYLRFHNTRINDVKPLASLTRLKSLTLNRTPVSDLTPLAGLSNLEDLWLGNTRVSDVTPLAGLTNLETLLLYNTKNVTDEEIEKLKLALPNCNIQHDDD